MGTYTGSYPAHGATGWDTVLDGIIDAIDARLLTVESSVTAATAAATAATNAANSAAQKMTIVDQSTSTITAVPNTFIRGNTTSTAINVTLPSTPADKSQVKVSWVAGASVVTTFAGGSAHFYSTSGATFDSIGLLNEVRTYTYVAATNYWTVESSIPLSAADSRYAPFSASFKGLFFYTDGVVTPGLDLIPNGMPIVSSTTLTAMQITLDYPTVGGTQVWNVILDHGGTKSTIGTVTIADGARGGVTNSLSQALVANDLILVQCAQANGTTYTGRGPTFRGAFGGTLALPSAPSAPSGLAATPGTTSVGLSWVAATGAFNYLIRRDGAPYAVTANTTYTDSGPDGLGLSPGETHTYNVDAMVPGNITVNNTGVVSGPGASYAYYPSVAENLSVLSTDFTITNGSNVTTVPATDSSGIATYTSGASGANNNQDKIGVQFIKDNTSGTPNSHSAWKRSWVFGFGSSAALVDMVFCAPAYPGVTASITQFLQFEFSPTVYRVGVKAAGYNSGSFYNLTASTTSPVQATTVAGSSSGNINWPITVTVDAAKGHLYGLTLDLGVIKGDGTQDLKVYMGTQAQLIAGTLPLINTITLSAAQRSALGTGPSLTNNTHWWQIYGNQTGTGAQTYFEQTVTIIPQTTTGN